MSGGYACEAPGNPPAPPSGPRRGAPPAVIPAYRGDLSGLDSPLHPPPRHPASRGHGGGGGTGVSQLAGGGPPSGAQHPDAGAERLAVPVPGRPPERSEERRVGKECRSRAAREQDIEETQGREQ